METLEPRRGTATGEAEPAPADLEPIPEVEEAFQEIEVDAPRVGIIMGSASDKPTMQPAGEELKERGIRFEVRVISAHRDPEAVADYAKNAQMRGLRVIIAGAGMSAALPGVVSAHTDLPVIGVPIKAKNTVGDGLDALLSTVQMPPGVPVACVAINGAKNAAVLAARILGC
jgi:5-(carboxyamino)imidazole ribonucleotide mutase